MEKPTRVVGQKRWVEVLRGENGRSMGWVEVFCQSDLFGRGHRGHFGSGASWILIFKPLSLTELLNANNPGSL